MYVESNERRKEPELRLIHRNGYHMSPFELNKVFLLFFMIDN